MMDRLCDRCSRVLRTSALRRRAGRGSLALLAAAVASVALLDVGAGPGFAQQQLPGSGTMAGGEDVAQGVFVRDSAVAIDRFALAERMESLKEWGKAAETYQDVLSNFADRVVPMRRDDQGLVYQYGGVAQAVRQHLASWPAEARQVYLDRFGPAAQAMLEEATAGPSPDRSLLMRVIAEYFVTDAAREAAIRLADSDFGQGHFAAAARTVDLLLERHPALGEMRPALLFRSGLAHHLAGEKSLAEQRLATLSQEHPNALGTVAGKEVVLAEELQRQLEFAPPSADDTAMPPGLWPTFAGSDDRNRLASAVGDRVVFYRSVGVPMTLPEGFTMRREASQFIELQMKEGRRTGIFPVARDGVLYFHDNVRVYAIDLDSGLPVPAWQARYGDAEPVGTYAPNDKGWSNAAGVACTLTATQDKLLMVLARPDEELAAMSGRRSGARAELTCLDRRDGRLLWAKRPGSLQPPAAFLEQFPDFKNSQFSGTPTVVGDTVVSLARGGRGQFEDSYAVGLSLEDGSLKWVTYLTSTSTSQQRGRRADMGDPDPVSPMAYAEGLLYIATDRGALAAVRPEDGQIVWLNLYERNDEELPQQRFGPRRMTDRDTGQPYFVSPVIVADGRVFYFPGDADDIYVADAATGELVKRIASEVLLGRDVRGRRRAAEAKTLLGVVGPRLILAGDKFVLCINWPAYDENAGPLANLFWHTTFDPDGGELALAGRPAVTNDYVIVPTTLALFRVPLVSGLQEQIYPNADRDVRWNGDDQPGNVLVLGKQIVISAPRKVQVFADPAGIRRELERQIARDPKSVEPRLKLAEISFNDANYAEAVTRLAEISELIETLPARQQSSARQTLFTRTLNFARSLEPRVGNPRLPELTAAHVDRFYDLAAGFARSPREQVDWRLSRAAFERTQAGPAGRVMLLQEILDDPRLGEVAVGAGTAGAQRLETAASVAREAIDRIKSRVGNEAYAAIESRAATAVAIAKGAGDAETLLALARQYPNASAASDALFAAAELFDRAGNPAAANQALRLVLKVSDKPAEVWLTLARNDLARPGRLAVAQGRLRRAAEIDSDLAIDAPLLLPDGSELTATTVSEAADAALAAMLAAEQASLPDSRFPLGASTQVVQPVAEGLVAENVRELIVPQANATRRDRILARLDDGQLACFTFGNSQPLWTTQDMPDVRGAAWQADGSLIAWNRQRVVRFTEDGQTLWSRTPGGEAVAGVAPEAVQLDERTRRALADDPTVAAADDEAGQEGEDVEAELARLDEALAAIGQLPPDEAARLRQLREELAMRRARLHLERRLADDEDGVVIEGVVELEIGGNRVRRQIVRVPNGEVVTIVDGQPVTVGPDADQIEQRRVLSQMRQVALRESGNAAIVRVATSAEAVAIVTADNTLTVLGVADGNERISIPLDGPVAKLIAEGDFVAARVETGSRSDLVAIDAVLGEVAATRTFADEAPPQLSQMTLSPTGELVYSTTTDLRLIDLVTNPHGERFIFEPSGVDRSFKNPQAFATDVDEGLLILGKQLFVLAEPEREAGRGSLRRDVLIFDLMSGNPLRFRDSMTGQTLPVRLTGPGTGDTAERGVTDIARGMKRIGQTLYLWGDRGLIAYKLDDTAPQWQRFNDETLLQRDPVEIQGVTPAKGLLFVFEEVGRSRFAGADPAGAVRISTFSREMLPRGVESGRELHRLIPRQIEGVGERIDEWQLVDGGVALVTGGADPKLVFLAGAAEETPTTQPAN